MEKRNFATYEYASKTVKAGNQTAEIDLREAFGWEATETTANTAGGMTVSFKRDRKIPHKQELNRLERKADNLAQTIARLKESKTKGASVFALAFGSISALVLGGGMSLCLTVGGVPATVAGIAIGVLGIVLCAVNYPVYKRSVAKKTEQVTPVIEENEEKLAIVCEQAHALLVKEEL